MRVSQADYRSVRVQTAGLTLFLRYCLYQDDEERLPESITCDGNTVVAYFLASTIRDSLGETPQGFYVDRRWKILREGRFALPFTLDLPRAAPFLFPGALAGGQPPASPQYVAESRLAYPNGLYVFSEPEGLAVFCDPEREPDEQGSIALWSHREAEHGALRLEVRYPDATRPAAHSARLPRLPRSTRRARRGAVAPLPCLVSTGSLERAHRLNVVCAAPGTLRECATAAVLERLRPPAGGPPLPDAERLKALLEQELRSCLEEELVQEKGICGLRRRPGQTELSALASCGLSLLLLRASPRDPQRVETALRLADFVLRAQHPSGLFYESFDPAPGIWRDSLADPGLAQGPALPAHVSALVACRLTQIAGLLRQGRGRSAGVQGMRLLHAARQLADALIAVDPRFERGGDLLRVEDLNSVKPGTGSLAFLELYAELYTLTARDPYRKAWLALRSRLLAREADPLPAADLERTLLSGRLAALAATPPAASASRRSATGGRAQNLDAPLRERLRSSLSTLLPWIYLNGPGSTLCGRSPTGALVPSLGASCLDLRGFQTAHLLLTLDRLLGRERPLPVLKPLVAQLLACTMQGPVGGGLPLAAGKGHSPEAAQPPDAVTRVGELLCLQRLLAEFASLFGGAAGRDRAGAGGGPT